MSPLTRPPGLFEPASPRVLVSDTLTHSDVWLATWHGHSPLPSSLLGPLNCTSSWSLLPVPPPEGSRAHPLPLRPHRHAPLAWAQQPLVHVSLAVLPATHPSSLTTSLPSEPHCVQENARQGVRHVPSGFIQDISPGAPTPRLRCSVRPDGQQPSPSGASYPSGPKHAA